MTTSQDGNVISNEATVGSRPWVILLTSVVRKIVVSCVLPKD